MMNGIYISILLVLPLVSTTGCGGRYDLMFVVDDSDSTKRNNPSDPDTVIYAPGVTAFIRDFIDNADLGPARLSILFFSETCRVISDFTSDSTTLTTSLSNLVPEYLGTDLSVCVSVAETLFQTQGRLGIPQHLIVLTDGASKNTDVASSGFARLESSRVDVISIAFGNAILMSELLSYAKDPSQIFKVTSDNQLMSLRSNVDNFVCQADPCAEHTFTGVAIDLYPFPYDCDRFIQLDPTGCTKRRCAYTTMWNNQLQVCDFPARSTCDPCRGQPDGRKTTYDLYCNSYWECQGGVSQAKCCGVGNKYVHGTGCVPAGPGECTNRCL